MAFNERLKNIREQKGFTQAQLATVIGVANNTYSQYETGGRKPNFETLKKIANFLEVSTDYLLEQSQADENSIKDDALASSNKPLTANKQKLTSIARLEGTYIDPEEDKQITQFVEFLLSKRNKNI